MFLDLKGSYDAILKIIILCIWCNRICWHALMFKKHIIFQILYIIVVPLRPTSLKCVVFYKAPSSNKCSLLWLANWPSALWLGCTLGYDVTLFPSHTHSHTWRVAQNSAFEQSIANTWTNNKTYLQTLIQKRQIVIAKSWNRPSFF